MRDFLAITGVIILALCLGVTSAYLSVDLTPPGLDLIRPPKAAVAAQMRMERHQSDIQEEASTCKYCIAVAELAQSFARHAKSARQQATALQEAMGLDKQAGKRESELRIAERSADGAEAAAAALTVWASRCKAEDFCRIPETRTNVAACKGTSTSLVSSSFLLAAAVRNAASGCAASTCPSVDCQSTAALRSDVQFVEQSLDAAGGRFNPQTSGIKAGELPVGASTLRAELKRVSDEAIYVTKMLPLMLDNTSANAANGHLPRLASDMVDERAVSAAQLASVMEHAAEIGDSVKSDPRNEAAWRLKSLAANLATLGKETETADSGAINWSSATVALGAALFDLARLQAILDRVSDATPAANGCSSSAPAAAQQLREAVAMLDLCRVRSACSNRGAISVQQSSRSVGAAQVAVQAQAKAEKLIVNEIGNSDLVQAAVDNQAMRPIDLLRSQQGVCVKAAELREASTAAPIAAQAVAESVTPTIQPVVDAVAPQDLVTGAVNSALNGAATGAGSSVVEASSPVQSDSGSEADVIPAAAPTVSGGTEPRFTGNLLSPSGPAFVSGDTPTVSVHQASGKPH